MTAAYAPVTPERAQVLRRRPWEAAECNTVWSISGVDPDGGTFTNRLAMPLTHEYSDSDRPVFVLIGSGAAGAGAIDPAWIDRATPLLLVLRDDPSGAYFAADQVRISDWQSRQEGAR